MAISLKKSTIHSLQHSSAEFGITGIAFRKKRRVIIITLPEIAKSCSAISRNKLSSVTRLPLNFEKPTGLRFYCDDLETNELRHELDFNPGSMKSFNSDLGSVLQEKTTSLFGNHTRYRQQPYTFILHLGIHQFLPTQIRP